jgi:hypothetical protein
MEPTPRAHAESTRSQRWAVAPAPLPALLLRGAHSRSADRCEALPYVRRARMTDWSEFEDTKNETFYAQRRLDSRTQASRSFPFARTNSDDEASAARAAVGLTRACTGCGARWRRCRFARPSGCDRSRSDALRHVPTRGLDPGVRAQRHRTDPSRARCVHRPERPHDVLRRSRQRHDLDSLRFHASSSALVAPSRTGWAGLGRSRSCRRVAIVTTQPRRVGAPPTRPRPRAPHPCRRS